MRVMRLILTCSAIVIGGVLGNKLAHIASLNLTGLVLITVITGLLCGMVMALTITSIHDHRTVIKKRG